MNCFSSFRSATDDDFYSSFSNSLSVNLTAAKFIEKWMKQAGYPVVDVNFNYSNAGINVTQERLTENSSKHDIIDYKWPIPLSFIVSSDLNTTRQFWLQDESINMQPMIDIKNETWFIFNINQTGGFSLRLPKENIFSQ